MTLKYFIVQAHSGYEEKVRASLQERVKNNGLEGSFGEILVPVENVVGSAAGRPRNERRKFYPGYVFVQMEMNDRTWHLVKDTPKVSGFLGDQNPTPVPEREIKNIKDQIDKGSVQQKPRVNFEVSDQVKVVDGAFANFTGVVEEVRPERQKLKVLVTIFGRPTAVELGYNQVEKITT
ncbi:MAG: transcription termination/antitermination protein NusG [Deltaproteobacteria bacterium]|jgi:transcriptional antiterminator NusG|nr:transcription termination/antitermination protein NusG [Deltaproteobacteria bacterium]